MSRKPVLVPELVPELVVGARYYDYTPRARHHGHKLLVLAIWKHAHTRVWAGYWTCWCEDCFAETLVQQQSARLERVPEQVPA